MSQEILKAPCPSCPYRQDVPSGVWHRSEYAKLPAYDASTGEQPLALFMCHSSPESVCNGWAVCHSSRGRDKELLALRLYGIEDVPEAKVPLFQSGQEASDHGLKEVLRPGQKAEQTIERLMRKKTSTARA